MIEFQHHFFSKSRQKQNSILFTIIILLVLCISVVGLLIYFLSAPILFIFIPILFLVFAPFIDVPQGVKTGQLIYLSPFLLHTKEKNNKIELHGGTLFDYYFMLDPSHNALERKQLILKNYVIGLLNLIDKFRERKEPLEIEATTYFIGENTAKKFGFQNKRINLLQKIILIFNYIPLLISNSIANKGFTLPKLSKARTIRSNTNELIDKEELILKYYERVFGE